MVPPNNLWNAFERQVLQDRIQLHLPNSTSLSDVMNKFVTQVGYPLLEVTESVADDLRKTLTIRQVRNLPKTKRYAYTQCPIDDLIYFTDAIRALQDKFKT